MTALLYDTSKLHKIEGIEYQKKSLLEVRDTAPTAEGGHSPLPEAVLWHFLVGEFPSASELKQFQTELNHRAELAPEVEAQIKSFNRDLHPMTQLSMGIMAC